jgi:hypothetical protein
LQQAARHKLQQRQRRTANPTTTCQPSDNPYARYQTDPVAYARQVLRFEPWEGRRGQPGQADLFADIGESVKAQLAGQNPIRIFRLAAGHGTGKTLAAAALVNWFFDCFGPSITITTAPTSTAVVEKLWKNIRKLRRAVQPPLPGRLLPADPKMVKADDWFAVGQTTSDSGGRGTERFQGQHDQFLFFVLDEAEGIPDFVYDAVFAMLTGGLVLLVLVLANPRTRTSRFHKLGQQPGVKSYRQSCLDFPNVVDGADTIPGGTSRAWVIEAVQKWCEVVEQHNDDEHTFDLPFDVPPPSQGTGAYGEAGTIFKPNAEFLFRVLGIAPANLSDDTFVPVGRFEAACKRSAGYDWPDAARMGIDCAGYGADMGTLYIRHAGAIWRAAQFQKADPSDYWRKTRTEALKLAEEGVSSLHIRIDAGGGFGLGVADLLKRDEQLIRAFEDYKVQFVDFGGTPYDVDAYADLITELYSEAGESLRSLAILNAPEPLEGDLCERRYTWVNKGGISVKKLEPKEVFRKRMQRQGAARSPDDGDGFCLSAAPDHIVESEIIIEFF